MFKTHDITNEGNRGRPSHPKSRVSRIENILNSRGAVLGSVELEEKDGAVLLTAVVDGKRRTITFTSKPAAKPRARKAKVEKAA